MPASSGLGRWLAASVAAWGLLSSQIAAAQARMDPDNPTCPANPDWSNNQRMTFTVQEAEGRRVLLMEGAIDDDLVPRLRAALSEHEDIGEIWLRSPGGNAVVGNQAGLIIRQHNMITRIPSGWACFSACNFLFMGGLARFVDPGGQFIVHMFTHTGDRATIRSDVAAGVDSTIRRIGEIEQDSALLASQDNDFLIRMGVSRRLLTDVMYQQNAVATAENRSTMRCLTQDEVRRYNVVNN